jgi:hypothetical protein
MVPAFRWIGGVTIGREAAVSCAKLSTSESLARATAPEWPQFGHRPENLLEQFTWDEMAPSQ